MKRHYGRLKPTDRRILVVYMQIPENENYALVVDTDALPPQYHDEIMAIVEGEGQKDAVLANVLSRRILSSTGLDGLTTLHKLGRLQKEPVENIVMYPEPNRAIPLVDILSHMGTLPKNHVDINSEIEAAQGRDNRIIENQQISSAEEKVAIARNILIEANMLEGEAKRKRDQAYQMAPELRPSASTAPKVEELPVGNTEFTNDKPVTTTKVAKKPATKTTASKTAKTPAKATTAKTTPKAKAKSTVKS